MRDKLNILSNLKNLTFKFNPLGKNTKSIRSVIPLATSKRVTSTTPECKVNIDYIEIDEPQIYLKYYNGFEQTIKTDSMDLNGIVDTIETTKKSLKIEEIKAKKTVETNLQELLQPVTKKKDTGAKANK
ncbi:ribosomal protein L53 [Tieghemostelium lacteum]|uniref:Large ribosomal subunit protein mL53 n=1 Tax=Tieghemostelium lacteum TaxID=361077 RepID=A0A152A6D5_TIELA|nr:ribosomal protein L53 [Tieghemostelium lacteum]|eukprot:KYR01792.1 ribosomal protein L53 [Tieghemostelium lacteum]